MKKLTLEEAEGLMNIGEAVAGIGFIISFQLFLIFLWNFEVTNSGVSTIMGIGIGLFLIGSAMFFAGVELRNGAG